jgi:hypothetical protein
MAVSFVIGAPFTTLNAVDPARLPIHPDIGLSPARASTGAAHGSGGSDAAHASGTIGRDALSKG